jgi:ribonuclease P protein component
LSLSFPKSARLYRAAEFQKLKREGTSLHGKFMVLSFLRSPSAAEPRVGFITSRRVGGAVVRNGVRRRLREIVRGDRAQLVRDCWLVLIARQRASSASFADLLAEWRLLARRGHLFLTQP